MSWKTLLAVAVIAFGGLAVGLRYAGGHASSDPHPLPLIPEPQKDIEIEQPPQTPRKLSEAEMLGMTAAEFNRLERQKLEREAEHLDNIDRAERLAKIQRQIDAEKPEDLRLACLDEAEDKYWAIIKINGHLAEGYTNRWLARDEIWAMADRAKQLALTECRERYGPK